MSPVFLFGLARQQIDYLGARQVAVTKNVANANTPGYKAVDVKPFADVMRARHEAMAVTSQNHIAPPRHAGDIHRRTLVDSPEINISGNNVSLETEMMRAGEIRRAYSINTSIVKAFHKMALTSLKG